MKYDLEERTTLFGGNVISFIKSVEKNSLLQPLLTQLIRSSTSIGANYCEAIEASSRKDFINKIYICKKEAHETKHWLRMIVNYLPDKNPCKELWQEAHELVLIFSSITSKSKQIDK